MAVTIADQLTRIQLLLQDPNAQVASRGELLTQHQDELTRLARERRTGDIPLRQGIAGQALYPLPATTVSVEMVLYNGQRLDYASETMLDRLTPTWEWDTAQEPRYWTVENQAPNVLRIIPAPRRTGSSLPTIPPAPFIMSPIDNLIVFVQRDFSDQAQSEDVVFPLMDVWEDVAVWRTVAELARREDPYQNLPLSQGCQAMAELWLSLIEGS